VDLSLTDSENAAMAIKGFLDAVDPMQIRGWAYDPLEPGKAVAVRAELDERPIAAGIANLYREDLEKAGQGDGSHAFIINLNRKLTPEEIDRVSVQAASGDGSWISLSRAASPEPLAGFEKGASTNPLRRRVELDDAYRDETQRPVFILGAARSGTSAMAQALLKLGIFEGNEEGHVLDLMAHLSVALRKFYDLKADDLTGRNTTISRVPIEFFQERLDAMLIDLAPRLFSDSRWIDKTPNSDMVYLAPRLKKIWPNSRFIFMRRRFLENAASRARKFPEYEFERNAREWGRAMEAWLQVRSQLHGSAIEIDQKFLSEEPELVGDRVARFLSLTKIEEGRLTQALRYDMPERTSPNRPVDYDLSQMGWGDVENGYFAQYCEKPMRVFGYSTGTSYYLPSFEANGFVYV
jgi:hypothetical protein